MSNYTVRGLDEFIVTMIRTYAAQHHVSQAEVITVALCALDEHFERNGYPEGWRIPRGPGKSVSMEKIDQGLERIIASDPTLSEMFGR